jgi:hypothetical protein
MFYEFDPEVVPVALAVGHQRVVYVITNTTTVYALKDTNGDRVANVVQSFQVPSVPIDAVLADSDSLESVVTLHDYYTYEQLVVSNDFNSDGFADAGGQVTVSDYVVTSPRALAVDSRTARIFVAGTDWYTLEDAVYFYQDTSGNKVVDAAFWDIPAPFVAEDSPAESFVSLAFLPQTRDLFILTHLDDGSGARILAARDNLRIPSYFSPSSLTVFSSSVPADAEDIDAIQLDDGTIEVQVVHEGDWNTCEVDDTNADGIADISECFALPDSGLKEAENSDGGAGPGNPQRIFCRVRITQVDYGQQVCDNWTCDSDHSDTWQYFLNAIRQQPVCGGWPSMSRSEYGPDHPGQMNAMADWIPVAPTPPQDVYIWPGATSVWRASVQTYYCHSGFCVTFSFKSNLRFMGEVFEMFDLPNHKKTVAHCGASIWDDQGVDSRDWACAALGPVSLPQNLSFVVANQVDADRECPTCAGEEYPRKETGLLKTRVRPHCWVNDPCPGSP